MAGQDRLRKGELYGAKINHSHVEGNIGSMLPAQLDTRVLHPRLPAAASARHSGNASVLVCILGTKPWQMSRIVKPCTRAGFLGARV